MSLTRATGSNAGYWVNSYLVSTSGPTSNCCRCRCARQRCSSSSSSASIPSLHSRDQVSPRKVGSPRHVPRASNHLRSHLHWRLHGTQTPPLPYITTRCTVRDPHVKNLHSLFVVGEVVIVVVEVAVDEAAERVDDEELASASSRTSLLRMYSPTLAFSVNDLVGALSATINGVFDVVDDPGLVSLLFEDVCSEAAPRRVSVDAHIVSL